ncbi:MAG: N-acetylmuramic acid 6-phosphate etherase [Thermonemataceae bacterium]
MNYTEASSSHDDLEKKTIHDLLVGINQEDQQVPLAVEKAIPQIEKLVIAISGRMTQGGRLFYIGAGTSGRLGIVDASECPPTFGVDHNTVIGLIAGGDQAIRKAVEFAEDDMQQGWKDLTQYNIQAIDTVVGIAASGRTPYVVGAIKEASKRQILTGCITCNTETPLAQAAELPIEVIVGPEFITGSTRMKAGTAQKLVLNMISTSVMIQLGKVKGNKMVDMQLSNHKLVERGIQMLVQEKGLTRQVAKELLEKYGSVRAALQSFKDL